MDRHYAPAEQYRPRGLLAPAAGVATHPDPIRHSATSNAIQPLRMAAPSMPATNLWVLRPAAESERPQPRQTGCRNHCSQEVAGGMDVHFVSDEAIEQHPVGELEQLLARDNGLVWVDIPVCDQEAAQVLREVFGFHPLAVQACS
jgi:hypothetical protein